MSDETPQKTEKPKRTRQKMEFLTEVKTKEGWVETSPPIRSKDGSDAAVKKLKEMIANNKIDWKGQTFRVINVRGEFTPEVETKTRVKF